MLAPSVIGWGFILIGFLTMLLAERRWPARTPLDWPLLLLALMGGVSLLVTVLPQATRVQVMRLGAGLAGFYGLVNWARDRRRLLLAAAGLVAGGVGMALLAPVIVEWSRVKAKLTPFSFYESFPLLVSDPVNPNIMAALMILLFPLPLVWLLSPGSSGPKWKEAGRRFVLGAASLLMVTVLLLTKSRGAYIAGAVGGLMVIWLSGRRRWAFVLTLVMIVVIVLGAWLLVTMENQAPELVKGVTDTNTWMSRQQAWRAALWMLGDFPFTGVGMEAFDDVASVLYAWEKGKPGAHSLYLQVGVDLGIPGLIAYLAVLMLTLWMAVVATRTFARKGDRELRAVTVGALSGMVALMIQGLVDVVAWGTRGAFFPWLVIGLITALFEAAARESSGPDWARQGRKRGGRGDKEIRG